jgi:hypothetical protein
LAILIFILGVSFSFILADCGSDVGSNREKLGDNTGFQSGGFLREPA